MTVAEVTRAKGRPADSVYPGPWERWTDRNGVEHIGRKVSHIWREPGMYVLEELPPITFRYEEGLIATDDLTIKTRYVEPVTIGVNEWEEWRAGQAYAPREVEGHGQPDGLAARGRDSAREVEVDGRGAAQGEDLKLLR